MSYRIRTAQLEDLPSILEIYRSAREYMRSNGNPNQWGDHHPAEAILREDIAKQQLYVCVENREILCVFAYIPGIDPTYLVIKDGQWCNDAPYGVIHRIAVQRHRAGIASFCFDWALQQCPNLRIDTHRDNHPMQAALAKNGFARCGIIHLANGDPRIAFHKEKTTE